MQKTRQKEKESTSETTGESHVQKYIVSSRSEDEKRSTFPFFSIQPFMVIKEFIIDLFGISESRSGKEDEIEKLAEEKVIAQPSHPLRSADLAASGGETQASPSRRKERSMERSPLWQKELDYSNKRRALRFLSESDYDRAAELLKERLSEMPLGMEQQKIFIVPTEAVSILRNNRLEFESLPQELVEVVTVLQMTGHKTEVEKWIGQPLDWYGGKTSEEVIAEGRGQQLIHHLLALAQGNIGV